MTKVPESVRITWLGHSTFIVEVAGSRILIDPWLHDNPACPPEQTLVGNIDAILVTHGHHDHVADAIEVALSSGAVVGCSPPIASWFVSKGVDHVIDFDCGGYVDLANVRVHMTSASHCSEITEGDTVVPAGVATGYVIEGPDGFNIYHAGDTDVFLDMQLIGKLLRPQIALLPIGGRYTMGPRGAAEAIRLLGVRRVIPMHWGTYPFLEGTPEKLRREASDVEGLVVYALAPGDVWEGDQAE